MACRLNVWAHGVWNSSPWVWRNCGVRVIGDAGRHQARHEAQVVLVHHIGALDLAQDAIGPERHAEASIPRARQADDAHVGDDLLPRQAARARHR